MASTFQLHDNVEITMRDGIVLRACVWLPNGAGPWPVLLQRTPYRKEDAFGTQHISGMDFMVALRRGYAIVVQDTRGRFGSDGEFVPFAHEGDDGEDTLAWLRQQAFCNGQIMMFGASYVGATQVLLAARNPDGLVAISPHLTTARHGATWAYRSGAIELGFLLLWIIESLGPEDLRRRLMDLPTDALEGGRQLLALMQDNPVSALERLPLLDDDLSALAPYAADWFNDLNAAQASDNLEHLEQLAACDIPMLVSCGWNDLFIEGSIELFETVRRRRARAEDVKDRLIIGPWSHGNPSDWQGDFWLGYAASTAALCDEQLRFFDVASAGKRPETPMVRYFRQGSNSWHAAPDWPLPGTVRKTLFLTEAGLSESPVQNDWQRSYLSDPVHPVPTIGGANFLPGLLQGRNSGPKNQSVIESRDDVLVFTFSPLEEELEITGLVEATLRVSSSAPSTDWTGRLCVVDPAGKSIGLVDGIIRTGGKAGEQHTITLKFGHISYLFRPGDRMRLQIASSNFPRFDRNPQTGASSTITSAQLFAVAENTVYGGGRNQSALHLSVVPASFPTIDGLDATA